MIRKRAEQTKEGLRSARAEGKLLGRLKGIQGKLSRTAKRNLLSKGVKKANIVRICGVGAMTMSRFIMTRKLA